MSEHTLIVEYDAKHVFFEFGPTKLPDPDDINAPLLKRRAPRRPPLVP